MGGSINVRVSTACIAFKSTKTHKMVLNPVEYQQDMSLIANKFYTSPCSPALTYQPILNTVYAAV